MVTHGGSNVCKSSHSFCQLPVWREKNKGIHVSTTEQKLFTALHFFHMLSCYIPNGLNSFSALKFYTQCPIMAMWKMSAWRKPGTSHDLLNTIPVARDVNAYAHVIFLFSFLINPQKFQSLFILWLSGIVCRILSWTK